MCGMGKGISLKKRREIYKFKNKQMLLTYNPTPIKRNDI